MPKGLALFVIICVAVLCVTVHVIVTLAGGTSPLEIVALAVMSAIYGGLATAGIFMRVNR
uniref:hypothetical protein n=1 Tax=Actinomadura sp. CA-154981 TaxID=3240037 RepID=UPI003F493862